MAMSNNKRCASLIAVDDEKRCKSCDEGPPCLEVSNPNPTPEPCSRVSEAKKELFCFPFRAEDEENLCPSLFGISIYKDPKPCKFTREEMDPKPFYDALIHSYHHPPFPPVTDFTSTYGDEGYFAQTPWFRFGHPKLDIKPSDPPDKDVISATVAEAGVDIALEDYNNFMGTDLRCKEIVRVNELLSYHGYLYFITFKASDEKLYETSVYYSCYQLLFRLMMRMRPSKENGAKSLFAESEQDVEQAKPAPQGAS